MKGRTRRRVVITGMGSVTGFGLGVRPMWEAILARRSALREYFPLDDRTQPPEVASAVNMDDLPAETAGLGKAARFGLAAAREAWRDAALPLPCAEPATVSVCIGASTFPVIEDRLDQLGSLLHENGWDPVAYARLIEQRPYLLTQSDAAGMSSRLSAMIGAQGPSMTVQAACTSATQAIGHAFETLRAGEGHIVLTGGTDSMLSMMCVTGFRLLGSLTQRWEAPQQASRPFDRTRDGFVLAEGAAMLVLEDLDHALDRGARIYAELIGYGSSCDAFRFTDMEPGGRGPAQSMRRALADAGIAPEAVGYINAHGTATPLNDRVETLAIHEAFGAHARTGLAVSSSKSQLGHLLCAAGAVEMVLTVLALQEGVLPATVNLHHFDPECDLDYIADGPRARTVNIAMSNSFGFGGQNGSLVVQRWQPGANASSGSDRAHAEQPHAQAKRVCITGVGVRSPLGSDWATHLSRWLAGEGGLTAADPHLASLGITLRGSVPCQAESSPIRNRMLRKILTRSAAHAVAAAGEALRSSGLDPETIRNAHLYVGSPGLDQDLQVFGEALRHSLDGGVFSYAKFLRQGTALIDPLFLVRSLPNAGLCGTAIEFDIQGSTLNVTNGSTSGLMALGTAAAAISRGEAVAALAGGYDSLLQLEATLAHLTEGRLAVGNRGAGYWPSEGSVFFVLEELQYAVSRGASILGEIVGFGAAHTPSAGASSAGLEHAARLSLRTHHEAPYAVFGDGLCLPEADAMERSAWRDLGGKGDVQTATQRLGFAGGVTGLFSVMHALPALAEAEGPVLAWTSDRGRNHAAIALRAYAESGH